METKRRLALALVTAVTCLLVPIPHAAAAPLPGGWCGPGELAGDRPDVVAPRQVHVIYAYPTDTADRFGDLSRAIVRDLAGVDTWWRSQDPARAPRFDFADFAGCDSEFGALDLSSLALTQDSSALDVENGVDLADSVGDDLMNAGFTDATKKYLVFYDGPAPENFCGRSASSSVRGGPRLVSFVFLQGASGCAVGGYGAGNGWPARTVAHELIHAFNDFFTAGGAPNACEDRGHVCESTADILSTGSIHPGPRLSDSTLDVGNDDYYHHPGTWWDVRDSPWLMHLESPPGVLSVVAAGPGGQVSIAPFLRVCPDECAQRYDGGTPVRLIAVVQAGYRLLRWGGACSGSSDSCDTTVNEDGTTVTATFGPAVKLVASAVGQGSISRLEGGPCQGNCSWDLIPGSQVRVVATPGPGARFAGWRGLCAGTKLTCTIAVSLSAKRPAVTAVFRPQGPRGGRTNPRSREP
ncbi:MAG: hypothetical protein WD271_01870 [Acidimicrobiia bacterium]